MQLRIKVVIIFAVIILVLSAAGYLLTQSIEVVKEKVYTGLKGEARTNPYLAIERLLKKRDFGVNYIHSEYQLDSIQDNKGTVFFAADRDTYKEQTLEKLLDWVISGGNLVAGIPYYPYDDEEYTYSDFFTEYVEVEVYTNSDATFIIEESETEEYDIKARLPGIDREISVSLDTTLFFNDTENQASWAIQQEDRNVLLQFKIGKGYLSLTGSLSFMKNIMIGEKDNISLFWYLTTLGGSKGDIWFVLTHEPESFWAILFQYTWMFLVSLFFFLLFFIWRSSVRFGPLITINDTERRSLIEHMFACGRFLWSRKQGPALLEALKQAVKYKIKTRLPVWDILPADDQLEFLKQRTELKEEVLNVLFISETREEITKNGFFIKAKLLERIYEKV